MGKGANDEKPQLRMQLSLRCLLHMKETSVDCSCSYRSEPVALPQVRGPTLALGIGHSSHGFLAAPYAAASGPAPRPSKWKPTAPPGAPGEVRMGWLPTLDTMRSNAPVSAVYRKGQAWALGESAH